MWHHECYTSVKLQYTFKELILRLHTGCIKQNRKSVEKEERRKGGRKVHIHIIKIPKNKLNVQYNFRNIMVEKVM